MRRTLWLAVACGGALTCSSAFAQQLKPADEAERSSLTYAVTSPLRDVNLMRSKIPAVLEAAYADPYRRPDSASCDAIVDEVTKLNAALGDDLDADNVKEISMQGRAKEEALSAIAGLASDVIPFRGWVRKLTGAERHDKRIQKSIAAGAVRRAYLKGLGEARGCNPPGTPLHKPIEDESTVVAENDSTVLVQNNAPIVTAPAIPKAAGGLTKTADTSYAPD